MPLGKIENAMRQAERTILSDKKTWKRLRYSHCEHVFTGVPTPEKQIAMLFDSILNALLLYGVTFDDIEFRSDLTSSYCVKLMKKAWEQGSLLENIKLANVIRKKHHATE